MNANEWLYLATLGMPECVRQRVRSETMEHLRDAGASNAADVTPILGPARKVNRELRWLYLTDKEWEKAEHIERAKAQGSRPKWFLMGTWAFLLWRTVIAPRPQDLVYGLPVAQFGVLLLIGGVFWLTLQPSFPKRSTARWLRLSMWSLFLLSLALTPAHELLGLGQAGGFIFLGIFLFGALRSEHYERRLEHTLKLVVPQAEEAK